MGALPAAGEARAQLIPDEARHALYATATMDTSSQQVAAALSRMRERDGVRSRAGIRLLLVPTGCLLTIRLTRLVFDSGNQARDRC
jgi:hypothetical protein